MSPSDTIVETDRLLLRAWRVDEAARFYDMHRRDEVARWISGRPMADPAEAAPHIEEVNARFPGDPRFGNWAVVDRESGIPAGSVLVRPLPDGTGEVEIGWHLHPDSWGRGFATEAARVLLDRGFALGLDEIWAVTHPENTRSMRVCEKLGMRLLGTTTRWYHEPLLMFWIGAGPEDRPSLPADDPEMRPVSR